MRRILLLPLLLACCVRLAPPPPSTGPAPPGETPPAPSHRPDPGDSFSREYRLAREEYDLTAWALRIRLREFLYEGRYDLPEFERLRLGLHGVDPVLDVMLDNLAELNGELLRLERKLGREEGYWKRETAFLRAVFEDLDSFGELYREHPPGRGR